MPPGKMAAQAGHAFVEALAASDAKLSQEYRADSVGTKIVLEADIEDLIKTQFRCEARGIPCVLIEDSGHILPPYFDGSPVVTALEVGLSPDAPKLLSQFKLKE